MDNRGANIDIVFRNGLKDYEVLPPPEAWNNINSGIKTKITSFIFLRVAALIAVAMMMSIYAYKLSTEIFTGPERNTIALNEKIVTPVIPALFDNPVYNAARAIRSFHAYPVTEDEAVAFVDNETEINNIASPDIAFLHRTGTLNTYSHQLLKGPQIAALYSLQKNAFEIEEPELLYLQEDVTAKIPERWSIAALASPTYYSKFGSGNNDASKQLMASEQPLLSYSGGVAFTYKISKRLSVQSGLYYSSLGQEVDGINSFGGFQNFVYTKGTRNFEVRTTSGTIYTNNGDVFLISSGADNRIMTNYTIDVFDPEKANLKPLNSSIRQNFSYLELPVVLRYKFVDRMIDFNIIGGLSYDMLINNSAFAMYNGAKYQIGKTEGLNPNSLSSSLGLGMEYNFSDKLSLNLEPTFRYYLNPFNQATGSGMHPYSFGIFSGLSFRF
jgi:hypothetical protein